MYSDGEGWAEILYQGWTGLTRYFTNDALDEILFDYTEWSKINEVLFDFSLLDRNRGQYGKVGVSAGKDQLCDSSEHRILQVQVEPHRCPWSTLFVRQRRGERLAAKMHWWELRKFRGRLWCYILGVFQHIFAQKFSFFPNENVSINS